MLKISRLTVENMETGCVTDNPQPRVWKVTDKM